MFQATFQNRPYSWTEFRPATPASINLGVDIARAICSLGPNEGTSSLDSSRARKELEESGVHNGNISDAFLIDDLSEFSNEEIAGPIGSSVTQISKGQSSDMSTNVCQAASGNEHHRENSFEAVSMFEQIRQNCKDIYAPCNDITELEWLSGFNEDNLVYGASNFVGDSFLITTEHEIAYGSGIDHGTCEETRTGVCSDESATLTFETSLNQGEDVSFETPVPGRARSKRPRSGVRSWPSTFLSDSPLMNGFNSSSDLSNLIASSPSFCPVTFHESALDGTDQDRSDIEDSPFTLRMYKSSSETKKAKKSCRRKKGHDNGQPRRCAHCLSQKTPQWRAGPTGPKTLCNACGVRFKSGRLFPEYRPAKSPTFVSYKHSNSHKRVLEMRNHNKLGMESGQGLADDLKVRFKLCATGEEEAEIGLGAGGGHEWFLS